MCIQIEISLGTFIFIMKFFPVFLFANDHALVKVNDPALITCDKPCSGDVKWKLAKRFDVFLSECRQGSCVEGHGFKNRTRLVQVEPSVHLNSVMYNDKGWYICYCDQSEICRFHLEILFPKLKSACVGENLTIPCYAVTDKSIADNEINVQWEKHILKLQKGKLSYGPGFEGRGFIRATQYKDGDLSLTIPKVQPSDGGIYRCTHRYGEVGEPEATALSIKELSAYDAIKQDKFPWWANVLVILLVVTSFFFWQWTLL